MSSKPNYFKIGLFVLVALGILIVGIIMLSAGVLHRQKIILETYFNESVVGLEAGSDVKYRGVNVGKVERISLLGQVYLTQEDMMNENVRYVIVYIALDPGVFEDLSYEQLQKVIETDVERGMRVRLASQGITGLAYLEIDYLDPAANPPLPISWKPNNYYLPSAPSVYTTLLDSLNGILHSVNGLLKSIEEIRINILADNVNDFLVALTKEVQSANVDEISSNIVTLVQDINKSNLRLQEILNNPNIDKALADAQPAIADLKESTAGIREVVAQLRQMTGSTEFKDSLKNLSVTLGELPQTVDQLKLTFTRLQLLLTDQEQNIDLALRNLEIFTHNLIELSRNANKYPAHILFGDPPQPPELKE